MQVGDEFGEYSLEGFSVKAAWATSIEGGVASSDVSLP